MKNALFIFASVLTLAFAGCKKDTVTTDPGARLSFSTDTVTFDTVFTEMGSATRAFRIYNNNNQSVIVSKIFLSSGSNSPFRMNVDGMPGKEITDLEIKAHDSAWVFVEVTIDPNSDTSPFVIFDEIHFITNGNDQVVILEAWGQNAYYYRPDHFVKGLPPFSVLHDYTDYFPVGPVINLPNDKPHVIFGYLVVDSAYTLNIQAGTRIHLYDKAGLWVYRGGVIHVNGELGNKVVFQGTRLEDEYDDLPGQWDRIVLNEGPANHTFRNVIIKNAYIGIQAEGFYLDGNPVLANNKVILYNTIIQNSQGAGMLVRNHNIEADNTLIANSGGPLAALLGAGTHRFRHCTLANFWSFGQRSDESVIMANYWQLQTANGPVEIAGDFLAEFGNSIIYGLAEEEFATDSLDAAQFDWKLEYCVLRTKRDTASEVPGRFDHIILNPQTQSGYSNPLFTDPYTLDFTLIDVAPAIDYGSPAITDTLLYDLNGNLRDAKPDLGCYRK